jgi:hypothetical protein
MEQPVAPVRRPFRLRTHGLAALLGALVLSALVVAPPDSAVAAGPVSISGVLFDSTGATAGREHIEAYLPDGGPGRGTLASWDQADLGGEFQLDGLEAGREYRLRINWSGELSSAPSFQGFVTNDPVDRMTQDPSRAALFVPGASGLTGVELRVEPATAISGHLRTPDGTPVEGVQVDVMIAADYNDLDKNLGRIPMEYGTSDGDGAFRVLELEYLGDGIHGYVVRVDTPGKYSGYVGDDPSMGLVPLDQARRFPPGPEQITGLDIVLPQVHLPTDQIILGPRIAPYKGGSPGGSQGQIMAVGAGTLSVFSFEDGVLTRPEAVRLGFEDKRIYAPGNWGKLDWFSSSSSWVGRNDIITVDGRGDMHLYRGDGYGYLRSPERIGWGWSGYRVIPVGDLDRATNQAIIPDLLAIDRNGDLWLYRGDGEGGFLWPPRQVGNGWIGYDLYSAGDLNRDGPNDILSVDTAGDLWMYAGIGDGTFATRMKVGNGWGTYTLAAGADIDGHWDARGYDVNWEADIVGRDDTTGDLYLYSGLGSGFFDTKRLIATGW